MYTSVCAYINIFLNYKQRNVHLCLIRSGKKVMVEDIRGLHCRYHLLLEVGHSGLRPLEPPELLQRCPSTRSIVVQRRGDILDELQDSSDRTAALGKYPDFLVGAQDLRTLGPSRGLCEGKGGYPSPHEGKDGAEDEGDQVGWPSHCDQGRTTLAGSIPCLQKKENYINLVVIN